MYLIKFREPALRFFNKLDKDAQNRIGKKIEKLKENPRLGESLTGNLTGLWKLRVSKYRIIYEIKEDKLIVYILNMGHRKNIYKNL